MMSGIVNNCTTSYPLDLTMDNSKLQVFCKLFPFGKYCTISIIAPFSTRRIHYLSNELKYKNVRKNVLLNLIALSKQVG